MSNPPGGIAEQVLNALRAGGHAEAARDLESWLAKLDSPGGAERSEAAEQVRQRCHPRWLGDLFVPGVGMKWFEMLDRLRASVDDPSAAGAVAMGDAPPPPEKPPRRPRAKVEALAPETRGPSGADLVRRLDRWLLQHRPDFHASLRRGLSAQALRSFEAALGRETPAAFRDFLRWRNGQASEAGGSFLHSWTILAVDEIERERGTMLDLVEHQPDWTSAWIPFLGDGGGDFVCLDLGGSFGGRPGQVLEFHHDDTRKTILHDSFHSWLESCVATLEAGLWKPKRDGVFGPGNAAALRAMLAKLNPGYPQVREGR